MPKRTANERRTRQDERGTRGPKGEKGEQGKRGSRGERGPGGTRGERGTIGVTGPRSSSNNLADQVQQIAKELQTQFERFAQLQQQLDDGSRALKLKSAAERFEPVAERDHPKRQ